VMLAHASVLWWLLSAPDQPANAVTRETQARSRQRHGERCQRTS
jgi:hypothetical protein